MLGFDAVGILALGQLDEEDQHAITSTIEIQLPIDCVLAGQQNYTVGPNFTAGRLLRGIFRE